MAQYIVSGKKYVSKTIFDSAGDIFFDCIKRKDPNMVIAIDAFTDEVQTYGDLLKQSIQLALYLRQRGVKRNDIISIICENNVYCFTQVLASLYVGATVNPVNSSYTIREMEHALTTTKPKIVFSTQEAFKNVVTVSEKFDFIEEIILTGSEAYNKMFEVDYNIETFKTTPVYAEDVAFILFSSGTTGMPKGVMMSHRSFKCSLAHEQDPTLYNVTSSDSTINVLPFFHIFGLYLMKAAIMNGMKIVLLRKFKPDLFLQCLEKYRATKLFVVPALLVFLSKSPLLNNSCMSFVKDIFVGGAPLGKSIETAIKERFPNVSLRQGYGITEMSGSLTITPSDSNKPDSIGRIVHDTFGKVCHPETQKSLGPNEIGELCFKGPGVMKGYIGDPKSTEDSIDSEGFFHTGDIGYYDEDGFFYIVDRLKDLIKYKGYQVSPSELETVLMEHPSVKEAAVIGIPDERAGEKPLAFIVKEPSIEVTEKEILDFVAEQVSVQKRLHGGIRFVDDIPKNANGKILRRTLRELFTN